MLHCRHAHTAAVTRCVATSKAGREDEIDLLSGSIEGSLRSRRAEWYCGGFHSRVLSKRIDTEKF